MAWQDIVFSIGNFVFSIALIPSIRSKDKPALSSSIVNSSFLLIFVAAFASLGLWLSAFGSSLTAIAWGFLAYQKHRQSKNTKPS